MKARRLDAELAITYRCAALRFLLCARIMAIADVFDAVSEKRCYRDAMPLEKCFEIIAEGSGQAFEPVLAETFLDICDKVKMEHDRINGCE